MYQDFKELQAGTEGEITVLVQTVQSGTTQYGDPYQKLTVRDNSEGQQVFYVYDHLLDIKAPAIARMSVKCTSANDAMFVKVGSAEVLDGAVMRDFLPKAHIDAKKVWDDLTEVISGLRPSLRRIVSVVLNPIRKEYKLYPVSSSGAFSHCAGILEATDELVKATNHSCDKYAYDNDLMVAAALLYYIGSVRTINNGFEPTLADAMQGSGLTSVLMVQEAILAAKYKKDKRNAQINQADVDALIHILMSREGGLPPVIPEAIWLAAQDKAIRARNEVSTILANATEGDTVNMGYKRKLCKIASLTGEDKTPESDATPDDARQEETISAPNN